MTAGEAQGVLGTWIDVNHEFGLSSSVVPQLSVTYTPGRRHHIRAAYAPIRYETTAQVSRDITFAAVLYPAGTLTTATISWNAFETSYEYDIISRRRVQISVLGEIDRTNIQVRLRSAAANELTSSSVPTIPAAGPALRVAITRMVSVGGELAELYVPDRPNEAYGGHYTRVDSRVVLALTPHVSAQLGFRAINIRHQGLADSGVFRLHGFTLGAVVGR